MAMGMYGNQEHPAALSQAMAPRDHMDQAINKTISTHRLLKNAAAKEVELILEKEKRRMKDDGRSEALTAEEKAQHSKDRNREHARSTRLRKKAYVSKVSAGSAATS